MTHTKEHSKLVVGISEIPFDLLVEPPLTQREKEILSNIRSLDKVIASDLHISYRTVVNHWVSIRKKTGLRSKTELALHQKQLIN